MITMDQISSRRKGWNFTKKQHVYLLSGEVVYLPIRLDQESFSSGRTIYLDGGNVNVAHDGYKWVECNPEGVN